MAGFVLGPSTLGVVPELLQRVLEWPQWQPGQPNPAFFVSIHHTSVWQNKTYFAGRPVFDFAAAAQEIDYWKSRRDVYFCTATITKFTEKQGAKGSYRKTERLKENAWRHKSMFLDIDVKAKAYATHDEARAALDRAVAGAGLPAPSFLIGTGSGGIHAYWPFKEAIPTQRYEVLTKRLEHALQAQGLIADWGCTSDVVRIMRVPGTFNRKREPATAIQQIGPAGPDFDVAELERILERWATAPAPAVRRPKVPVTMPDVFLGANMDPAFAASKVSADDLSTKRIDCTIEDVAAVCPFIEHALATGGADLGNALWLQTINIAVHIDSRDAAHRMACKHEDYLQPPTTDETYDRQFHVKHSRPNGLGWTSCANMGAPECTTCPKLMHGRSPLHFAVDHARRRHTMQTTLLPAEDLPEGYRRMENGWIEYFGGDQPKTVCNFPMSDGEIVIHRDGRRFLHFASTLNGKPVKNVLAAGKAAPDVQGMLEDLGNRGLLVSDSQKRLFKGFVMAWIQQLQETGKVREERRSFGWNDSGFVTATTYYAKGQPPAEAYVTDIKALQNYQACGSLDAWQDAARAITSMHRPDHNLILVSAFASPLVQLTDRKEALWLAVHGKSGVGKSTTMRVSQAAWGSQDGICRTHTKKAMIELLGDMNNLPFMLDDVYLDRYDVRRDVLQIASGVGTLRLDRTIMHREVKRWCNLTVSSSNKSIHDMLTQESDEMAAQVLRVFEFTVAERDQSSDVGATHVAFDKRMALLDTNYGRAGEVFVQWLVDNRTKAKAIIEQISARFGVEFHRRDNERYWFQTMTVEFAAAYIAREIGLLDFSDQDMVGIKAFLGRTLENLRGEHRDSRLDLNSKTAVDYIVDFVGEHWRSNGVKSERGLPKSVNANGGAIWIEKKLEDNTYLVKLSALEAFMLPSYRHKQERHSVRQVLNEVRSHGAKVSTEKMCEGAKVKVLKIDGNHPSFADRLP